MTNKKYIDAEAFKRRVMESAFVANRQPIYDIAKGICEMVDFVEPADVALVVHGCWIDRNEKTWCSVCDASNKQYKPPYCPHCGAMMDGENAEHCVSCGENIPEGRQVCPACEGGCVMEYLKFALIMYRIQDMKQDTLKNT